MIDQEMQHCRKIVRFDPTISTANQGDFIIRNACEHVLHDCFPVQLSVAVPVRDRLSKVSMKHVGSADFAFGQTCFPRTCAAKGCGISICGTR